MPSTPNYTDEQVSKMLEAYGADSTMQTVESLAEEFGKTKSSIISKLVSLSVYKKAEKGATASTPKVKKADVVSEVQALFTQELPSLKNMTVVDLQAIAKQLGEPSES